MTTLQDYVAREFPNHDIELWDKTSPGDLELTSHTVVSSVVGTRGGLDVLNAFRRRAPEARVAALAVRPTTPTLVPTKDETHDGPLDVPVSRVATSMVVGALVAGLIFGVLMWMIQGATSGIIVGVFAAVVGAAVGAIVSGARFAGQRATTQPQAPGRTITVVAAFCDDDASAESLAGAVGAATDYEVRIVGADGGWRVPATGGD